MIPMSNNQQKRLAQSHKFSFEEDIVDLFSGTKSAHLASHTFGYSPHLWEDFFNSPSKYYVIKDEVDLIKQNILAMRKVCRGTENIIDLGPGSEGAVINKTFPFLRAFQFNLKKYIAIDVSTEYLQATNKLVQDNFDVDIKCINDNFFNPQGLNINDRTVALLFGLTLSNMPGIVDKESGIQYLTRELKLFRNLLPKGAYFLCSFDTCQNEQKLMDAYYHPKHAKFIESIAFKIKNELNPEGDFDPNDWFYAPQWDAKNHMFRHVVTSKREMNFSIGRNSFYLPQGHNILSYMSVKFPESIFIDILNKSGFELASDFMRGPDGDIVIALMKAA